MHIACALEVGGGDTGTLLHTYRMASKIAPHIVCNGMDIRSSSSVTAGYFARGIFFSLSLIRVYSSTPSLFFCSTLDLKMNVDHCALRCMVSASSTFERIF